MQSSVFASFLPLIYGYWWMAVIPFLMTLYLAMCSRVNYAARVGIHFITGCVCAVYSALALQSCCKDWLGVGFLVALSTLFGVVFTVYIFTLSWFARWVQIYDPKGRRCW